MWERGAHQTFVLNSSLPRLFIPNWKGGRGCPLFSLGIAMFPAHHLMYRFPKSWIGVGGGGGRSP